MIDRRRLLAATPALLLCGPPARARGRALRIDANLVPPITGGEGLSHAAAAMIRTSGLTAIRVNVDGDGTPASAEEAIATITAAIAANPMLLRRVWNVADLAACRRDGRLGLIFGFEQAELFAGDPAAVTRFAAAGVRIMQLSYNGTSSFGSGVLSTPSIGLTALGREAVARMIAAGVTLDLSHSDTRTTLDALTATTRPAAITHAGCAAVTPHPRNKPDAVLRRVAAGGGVIGVYDLPFLAPEPRQPDITLYMTHLIHALNTCGEDGVGIGSDTTLAPFDTSPQNVAAFRAMVAERRTKGIGAPGEDRLPFVTGLNTPRRVEVIADALRTRGWSARVADKVCGGNWQRLFAATWR